MAPKRPHVFFLAIMAAVVAVSMYIALDTQETDPERGQEEIPYTETGSWMKRMRSGEEVEFRQRVSDSGEGAYVRTVLKGRIASTDFSGEAKKWISDLCVRWVEGFTNKLNESATRIHDGDLMTHYEFLGHHVSLSESRAFGEAFQSGNYLALDKGEWPFPIPENYIGILQEVMDGGKKRYVAILAKKSDYPELQRVREERREIARLIAEQNVARWNSKSSDERKTLWQQAQSAKERIRNASRAYRAGKIPFAELSRIKHEQRTFALPLWVKVNKHTFMGRVWTR